VRLIARGYVALGIIVCLLAMTWACSTRTPPPVPAPAQTDQQPAPVRDPLPRAAVDECALIDLPGEPIATVGLGDRIDLSNAPHPTNPSERLLFGQLYETLVRVDCMGRLRPGLATSWQLDQRNGVLWTVTLRENARFSDGTPVTAADVRASWTRGAVDGWRFRTPVHRLVDWVEVVDDRTLVIQPSHESRRLRLPIIVLSHPNLAVAKWVTDSPVPLGTRSSRSGPEGDPTRRIALSELTVSRDQLPPLRFLVAAGDQRDLLDAGVDLLITRDPATLDYAATLTQFERVPLAWQQTHVLLIRGRAALSPSLSDDARQALAADAVRGEARGAQGPLWFETVQCEPYPRPGIRPYVPTPRIVYDADDGVARDLAERLVALVGAPSPRATEFLEALLPDGPGRTFQRATGLTGQALADARQQGTDAGYIVSVDRRPLDPCNDLDALKERVPWLDRRTIIPLVDTRRQAIVRRGRSGATTEFDGAIVIGSVSDPASR
jgi:hypothetical protein